MFPLEWECSPNRAVRKCSLSVAASTCNRIRSDYQRAYSHWKLNEHLAACGRKTVIQSSEGIFLPVQVAHDGRTITLITDWSDRKGNTCPLIESRASRMYFLTRPHKERLLVFTTVCVSVILSGDKTSTLSPVKWATDREPRPSPAKQIYQQNTGCHLAIVLIIYFMIVRVVCNSPERMSQCGRCSWRTDPWGSEQGSCMSSACRMQEILVPLDSLVQHLPLHQKHLPCQTALEQTDTGALEPGGHRIIITLTIIQKHPLNQM